MYTMGHKALVLNTLRAGDTIDAAQLTISGFCNFIAANITPVVDAAAVVGVDEISAHAIVVPAGLAVGDTVNVEVKFNQGGRYISEFSSNFIEQGDTVIFQSAPVATADAAGIGAAVNAGWVNYLNVFNVAAIPPLNVTGGATDITVTAAHNFIRVENVTIKTVPAGAKTAPAVESKLVKTIGTAGTEGNGQGKFLEESIRTASYTNMDPYSNKPNGSDSVDIRGSYRLYEFTGKSNAGWEGHENLGTAIADQNVTTKDQKFTIYANEGDAALMAALDLLP